MDYKKLADILFPDVTDTPEDIYAKYPKRELPEGAAVTRMAPSPTGFVHFGSMFPTITSERLAKQIRREGLFSEPRRSRSTQ